MPQVIENLNELEDDGEQYYGIKDLWPDVPELDADFGWNPDEN